MKVSVFFDHILQAEAKTGKPLATLLHEVRNAGIKAVEINMSYLCEHEEIYELLEEAGLLVSCVYEFYEMDHKDEKEKAKKHINTALKAGAQRILVVPGFFDDYEAAQMKEYINDYDRMSAFLSNSKKAVKMAEGLSYIVRLANESGGPEMPCESGMLRDIKMPGKTAGGNTGILVTVEDFDDAKSPLSCVNGLLWFFNRVPDLKCTFDTGNFIIHREDVLTALETLKDRIVHIHLKDRSRHPVAVGDGYIPIKSILNKMQTCGYNGYYAIEHFDAPDQEECILRSASYLKLSLMADDAFNNSKA